VALQRALAEEAVDTHDAGRSRTDTMC
jgi:hypothetical protein